jgi:hypothetical protein
MSKFIKHIEFKKNELKPSYVDKLRSQPNCGDAIYNVKGNGVDKIVFASNSESFGKKDRKTSFTWDFGYNEGHPCIFITFTEIDKTLHNIEGAIVCLETNTLTKMKNKSISAFEKRAESTTNENYKYLTWFPINEIEIGETYCIYIIGYNLDINGNFDTSVTSLFGPWKFAEKIFYHEDAPSDWEISLNIRPTIRKPYMQSYIHHLYHNMPEYKRVSYLKGEEYHLN